MKPLLCTFPNFRKKIPPASALLCEDFNATDVAQLTGIRRKAMTMVFLKIRQHIAQECERASPFSGEVEVDECCFGARRVRGKRGRDASCKTPVFGLLKRNGKAYTDIVPDCWRGYDGLVDVGYPKRYRVNHGKNEFARGMRHINGIESSWSFDKHRLQKFHGIAPHTFNLHLKNVSGTATCATLTYILSSCRFILYSYVYTTQQFVYPIY